MIDTPAACVDYLNTNGKLHHCTRRFRKIGLSGYRPLNLSGKDGNVIKNTQPDQILSDDRRAKSPEMYLWHWAKICNCRSSCSFDHAPIFTGVPVLPICPVSEEYAKDQLMIFSKGLWRNADDLKGNHDNFTTVNDRISPQGLI